MVLNKNLHEFDELEKHSLKDKIKSFFEDLGNFFGNLLIFIIFLLLILLLLGGVIAVFQELYNNVNNYECIYKIKE